MKPLGRRAHEGIEEAMRAFVVTRRPDAADPLWLVEHDPVFTQGTAGRPEHVLGGRWIPVVRTWRGGQVTADPLVDLQRPGASACAWPAPSTTLPCRPPPPG